MREDECRVRAGDPALPGRQRLVRAARRVLWQLINERARKLRIARSHVRRRLGDFLGRCAEPRLLAILRSAALSSAVAAALLAPGAVRAQDFPAIELAAIARGEGGFVLRGEGEPALDGGDVAGAGDVNGDGIPDLVVGGPIHVAFGTRDGAPVELAKVRAGEGGFAILEGWAASDAGDVNGDGLADLLAGEPVVFGKTDGAPIKLSDVVAGRGGFAIPGALWVRHSVTGAGDVNGDGLADIATGKPGHSPGGINVVFGKPDGAPVDLSEVQAGRGGFAIRGSATGSNNSHQGVAGAGDVNGDGLADLLLGAPLASPGGRYQAGESHVIFGKADGAPVELSEVSAGQGGFVIRGVAAGDGSGDIVSGAGDVNGDGLADVLVGSPTSGKTYVVLGKPDGAPVELSSMEASQGGFVIRESWGPNISGAGDVSGDGLADILIGGSVGLQGYAGQTEVVFGKPGGAPVFRGEVEAGRGGFAIRGGTQPFIPHDRVSGTGDVNGDGLADIAIGGREGHIVFGKADGALVELSAVTMGQGGFAIHGRAERSFPIQRVSGAGDVNGDGRDDVLLGAPAASHGGTNERGESYVVFGQPEGAPVDLSAIQAGQAGFAIRGEGGGDRSGSRVSGPGDVNGDGLADVLVSVPMAFLTSPDGTIYNGESYVVFGKRDGALVELREVRAGQGGFAISGVAAGDLSGDRASGAGDVNGDGLADLLFGDTLASPGGRRWAGESYVVFGKPDGAPVAITALQAGQGGFVIRGAVGMHPYGDFSGSSVSGAGDVNGDGLADVLVGAIGADPGGRNDAGESYVVFGKQDGAAVELSQVKAGRGGFVIRGAAGGMPFGDSVGSSVSGAGDVNGDGLADVLVGAIGADPGGRTDAGESYVVFGKQDGAAVELSQVQAGRDGFVIRDSARIAAAGDINDDGLADLIAGAPMASPEGREGAGESYVVFGKADGAPVELARIQAGQGGFAIRGRVAGDGSGLRVSGAGDIDGDGLADDLIIASGLADGRYPGVSGAAYVIFGPKDGGGGTRFRRGAVRGEEGINLTDAVVLLGHLFLGEAAPPCLDAADADDSGKLDLADAISLLGHLFLGAVAPPDPGPTTCGRDPTEDDLGCASPTLGCES